MAKFAWVHMVKATYQNKEQTSAQTDMQKICELKPNKNCSLSKTLVLCCPFSCITAIYSGQMAKKDFCSHKQI